MTAIANPGRHGRRAGSIAAPLDSALGGAAATAPPRGRAPTPTQLNVRMAGAC